MAKVIAYWDLPAALLSEKAAKKLLQRWTHTAKCFGVSDIAFIEKTALPPFNDAEMRVECYTDLQHALDDYADGPVLYVEQGGEPLKSVELPENAVFVFGSDYNDLPRADIGLTTVHGLHAEMACAIVLNEWSERWLSA